MLNWRWKVNTAPSQTKRPIEIYDARRRWKRNHSIQINLKTRIFQFEALRFLPMPCGVDRSVRTNSNVPRRVGGGKAGAEQKKKEKCLSKHRAPCTRAMFHVKRKAYNVTVSTWFEHDLKVFGSIWKCKRTADGVWRGRKRSGEKCFQWFSSLVDGPM